MLTFANILLVGPPQFTVVNGREIKLGLITPPTGKLGFERVAAATTMAMEDAHADGYLEDTNVTWVRLHIFCVIQIGIPDYDYNMTSNEVT